MKTPVHQAVKLGNIKSLCVLVSYLAKLDYIQLKTFRLVLPELVGLQGFTSLLRNATIETAQLQNKQSLAVNEVFNEEIVAITEASSSYIDETYYEKHMKENKQYSNIYPVTVKLVEVGWILQEPTVGVAFLAKMCEQENLEMFSVESVQMIIEFLYDEVKWFVLKQRLVPHIFQLCVFILSITFIQF